MCGEGAGEGGRGGATRKHSILVGFYCSVKLHDYAQLQEEKGSFSLYFQITARPGGSQASNSGWNLVEEPEDRR